MSADQARDRLFAFVPWTEEARDSGGSSGGCSMELEKGFCLKQ